MKINVILSLLFICIIPLNVFCTENTCQEDDYIALRDLYLSTDGDNWNNNTGWLTATQFAANPTMPAGTNVGNWNGVTLDGSGCVNGLYLEFNNLSGPLPPEIGNLVNLTFLSLNFNQLTGPIPPELGSLNLITLGLSDNQMSGCYDENLTNLCTGLNPNFNNNGSISNGNNFDATWENFCNTGAGTCVSSCPTDIAVDDIPIPNSLYQAQQTISSVGQVASGTDVAFKAGECIMLGNDFTVQPGASLSIEIEDCQ